MNSIGDLALSELVTFSLAAARVAGLIVSSPFPGRNVPNRAKVSLVLAIAWVARGSQPMSSGFAFDLSLFPLVMGELGLGLLVGFVVRVTFSAAEMLGLSVAQSTGLTLGSVYDAGLGSEDPIPARIINLFAMLLFLILGAHRVSIGYLIESFRALPLGTVGPVGASAGAIVDIVAKAMAAGVRLSVPVMAVGLAVQISLALIARAAPTLQVFSVGMGVAVAAGLLAILGSMQDATKGLVREFEETGPRIDRVMRDVGRR